MRMAKKSRLDSSEQSSASTQLVDPSIDLQQELDRWQRLLFSPDMGDSHNNPRNTRPRGRSASVGAGSTSRPQNPADVEGAVLLAQFAAAMQYTGQDPDHPSAAALRNLMSMQQYTPQPVSPNLLNPGPSWPAQSYNQHPFGATQFQHPILPPINPAVVAGPSSFPINSPTSPTTDPDEAAAITEDKRRRNTAASARFRIKKKIRTLNLERSVSDLTGRAEELEREAADLRRENGWLKEIVMLKGSRLAGMDLTPDMLASSTAEISRGSSSKKAEAQSDSEQNSSDEEQHHGRKGKGKAKEKQK